MRSTDRRSTRSRSHNRRTTRRVYTVVAPVLLVPLLLGSASQPFSRSVRAIPGISDRASLLYADAASAVRGKDCANAFRILAPLTADRGAEGSFARLLTGFYAHACEQVGLAEDRLFTASDPDGVLEDWRLYILSDSAAARGHVLVAQNDVLAGGDLQKFIQTLECVQGIRRGIVDDEVLGPPVAKPLV